MGYHYFFYNPKNAELIKCGKYDCMPFMNYDSEKYELKRITFDKCETNKIYIDRESKLGKKLFLYNDYYCGVHSTCTIARIINIESAKKMDDYRIKNGYEEFFVPLLLENNLTEIIVDIL